MTSQTAPQERAPSEICAFVQARMSSKRFPGKVLAPFRGRPLIDWVVDAVQTAVPAFTPVVVLTSDDPTDDPLATYLEASGRAVFRGPLDDVLERFRQALRTWPCEWVLRVNADSPLLSPDVLKEILRPVHRSQGCDLVTTIHPRTFPKGQNGELVRAGLLGAVPDRELLPADREHVTHVFYRTPGRYAIVNVVNRNPACAELDFAVDTIADLHRLEQLTPDDVRARMALAV